jgi:hypothetical protein
VRDRILLQTLKVLVLLLSLLERDEARKSFEDEELDLMEIF